MLLRRNGEVCEHPVPGYPGLLTDSEQKAYTEVITSMAWLLKELNDAAVALVEIEKTIPALAKQASDNTPENSSTIRDTDSEWQIHRTLHKSARNEVLLCSRRTEQGTQFGIVEQFTHNSVYANARGEADVQMTSNQASLLLQDYLAQERQVLQLFKQDIIVSVEETLAEKFPGQDYSRVIKAISASCEKSISPEDQQTEEAERQSKNVRIRF